MKNTKLILAASCLVLATSVALVSCAKKTTPTPTSDTSTTSSTDNNTAQQNAHDITNFGSEGIDNSTLTSYRLANGGQPSVLSGVSGTASVTINASAKTADVTFINFVGYDGHTRNGTIHYDWSTSLSTSTYTAQYYRDSGLVLNITTPGNTYVVDNYTVEVNSKQIKNIGRVNVGGSLQLTWTDVSNITVLKPSGGGTIQWNGNWSIALLNTGSYSYTVADGTTGTTLYPGVFVAYGNPWTNYIDWTKALVSVSGTFGGTASDGETYTGNISTPLVLNFNCTPMWSKYLYTSGVLNFTPTGKTTRTINYGTGTCDLTYVVSIGSYSLSITI